MRSMPVVSASGALYVFKANAKSRAVSEVSANDLGFDLKFNEIM